MTPERIHKQIKIINADKVFEGSLDLSSNNLTSLEQLNLSDVIVTGNFWCSYNTLNSLIGAPKKVYGSFWCDVNNLTSLEGLPESIGGSIWIEKEVLKRLYFTNPLVAVYSLQDKFILV